MVSEPRLLCLLSAVHGMQFPVPKWLLELQPLCPLSSQQDDERGESTLFKDVFQKSMAFPVISFLRRTWSFSQVTLVKLGGELAVGSWLQKLLFFLVSCLL